MTTIKNLRDEDGLFYPRTHMKAVLNNDGTNVQNLINSVNEDIAQSEIKANIITSTGDGSLYLSNDGTYKELPPIDTDEHLYITVTSNQPQPDASLYGTIIVVNDTTDNASESFTWNGTKIHKKIPYSHVYTVTTTAVEGYSTPDVKTFTAALQGSNEVELNSNTCVLSFESTVFAEVTISYDGITRLTNSSNIIKVPYGKTVTVTPHTVESYTAPSAFTVNADAASKTITLNYIQSQLKVNILSNQGTDAAIANVKATVKYGSTSVQVANGGTVNLPTNTSVTISFPEVADYKKPADITYTHTGGLVEKSGTYKCELLTVNVSADQGSVSGFEVAISKQATVGVETKYTRLEYIQSSGSQYIDTGFNPNQNTKMYLDVAFLSPVGTNIAGVRNTTSDTTNRFGIISFSSASKIGAFFRDSSIQAISYNTSLHSYELSKSGLIVDGTSYGSSNNGTFACTYPITLGAWNNGEGGVSYNNSKIYGCKIYDNGILVRDYTPALRSDGIAGLYDAVNDTFTASSGSGNFIAGNKQEEIIATQTTVTGSYKIPFNTSYVVKAGNVNGYTTPSSVTRVASAKSYTVTQEYKVITVRDLSLIDVYGNPINRSTANCYVIREAGQYKFPCVYGNAIKNGKVNTAAYTNNGGSYSHDFVDGGSNVIYEPWINEANQYLLSVDLPNWDIQHQDIVSDLRIEEDSEGYEWISFNIIDVPSEGGNFTIVLRGENIFTESIYALWSWHIWLWPHDLSPVEITNSTGVKYNIMPVNLASKYDSDGVHIKNWFYQWGRPNPMLLPSAWNSTTDHTPGSITKTSKASDLATGLNNPSTFYYNSSSPYNWFGTKSYYNLWDAACTGTGNSDNDTVKTVYDPCPVGWKVPNGNTFTGFSIINDANGIVKFTRYSGDSTGVGFPMSGYRDYSDGSLINVGSYGCVWLLSASSQGYAYLLNFDSGYFEPQSSSLRATGFSVRPVQE